MNYIVHCLSLISHWPYGILGKVVESPHIVCFTSIDGSKVKDLVGIFFIPNLCLYEVPTVDKSLKQAVCYLENVGSKDNIYTIVFCLITSQSDLFLWSLIGENI